MPHFDVIVIGAGAAGLAAAHHLTERGLKVAIVEARGRIGGRILTSRAFSGLPTELGAEFIHGRPPETFAMARAAHLTLCELSGGEDWFASAGGDGRFPPAGATDNSGEDSNTDEADEADEADDDSLSPFLSAVQSWDRAGLEDVSAQTLLDTQFAGNRWAATRRRATGYVEGFHAARLDEVSVQWLAHDEAAEELIDGNRQFRLIEGYDRLLTWLHDQLSPECTAVLLHAIVREVHWSPGHVEVRAVSPTGTAIEPLSARAAVITLPVGVLAAPPEESGGVRFVPDLPAKHDALRGVAMGHVVKVLLHFREPFWDQWDKRDSGAEAAFPALPQLSFLFSEDAVIPTWWTSFPMLTPVLTGWAGGPRAAQLVTRPDADIAGQAIHALARVLRLPSARIEAQLTNWEFHNWSADPFARGAYSYTRVGGRAAQRSLAEPVARTLFFAGEATQHTGQSATVHGALASGQRAAHELIDQS